uniref:Uncharacterized protein n=1 Tax=Panagrolaimus davidi TaxID=227884 RepID=A0A914PVS8_9BILA
MTKVTEPWPLFVTYFYYYYSYFSLCLTWIISPFLFYTIFTQSKTLGNFKWFILNHSFWCLAFETVFGIFKPMLLPPIAAGYQLGPFRHLWNWKSSIIAIFLCLGITGSCVISVSATLASRYLLIFPGSLFKWFNLKIAVGIGVLLNLACYGLIIYALYPLMELEKSTIIKWVSESDPGLSIIYSNEPTFVLVPKDYHLKADIIVLAALFIIHLIGAFILLFFFYQLRKQKRSAILTNKVQRSLIISSLFQMLIVSGFLLIPLTIFFTFIFF